MPPTPTMTMSASFGNFDFVSLTFISLEKDRNCFVFGCVASFWGGQIKKKQFYVWFSPVSRITPATRITPVRRITA